MIVHAELKRVAEAANAVISDVHVDVAMTSDRGPNQAEIDSVTEFLQLATPALVLELIAENERLSSRVTILEKYEDECLRLMREAEAERDQLKRDNASLRGSCAKLGREHAGMVRAVRKMNNKIASLNAEIKSEVNSCLLRFYENKMLKAENEVLRKDAGRYRWLRANEFDIGSYHPESEHNHKSWFENFDDESIDLAIYNESEFAAEAKGNGEQS